MQVLPESSAHYRTSFMKAVAIVAACFLLSALGFSNVGNTQIEWLRGNGAVLGSAGITCMLFASVVAYVRFVDWRHRLEMEGKTPARSRRY